MKIVIAGAGDMGTHLAKMLSGNGHDITVADLIVFAFSGFQNAVYSDLNQIVTLTDDRTTHTPGNSSDFSFHIAFLPWCFFYNTIYYNVCLSNCKYFF